MFSKVSILILCSCIAVKAQDTLMLTLDKYQKTDQVKDFLTKPKGVIILQSSSFDDQLMELINQYRSRNNLAPLNPSIRLDTLIVKQIKHCIRLENIIHYPNILEMNQYKDLLGAENLATNHAISTSIDLLNLNFVNAERVLNSWINSKHHNENLLISQKNADVASCLSSVVIKFSNIDNKFFATLTSYYVLEIDYHSSVRENVKTYVPKGKPVFSKRVKPN